MPVRPISSATLHPTHATAIPSLTRNTPNVRRRPAASAATLPHSPSIPDPPLPDNPLEQIPTPAEKSTCMHSSPSAMTPRPTRRAPPSRIIPPQPKYTVPRTKTSTSPSPSQKTPQTNRPKPRHHAAAAASMAPDARPQPAAKTITRNRMSTGPLSAHTMSQIRCPTRIDFLNAVNGLAPATSTPNSGATAALARSRSRNRLTRLATNGTNRATMGGSASTMSLDSAPSATVSANVLTAGAAGVSRAAASGDRNRGRTPRVALRTSRLTDETDADDGAQIVAGNGEAAQSEGEDLEPAVGANSRDAALQSGGDGGDELDAVAGGNGGANSSSDGEDEEEVGVPAYLNILVLDAMDHISECDELKAIVEWMNLVRRAHGYKRTLTDVDLTNGVALLQVLAIVAKEAFQNVSDDASTVQTLLDEHGRAARENIEKVRAGLQRFPWCDGPDGAPLKPVPFDRVDIWGLAGFVVLAAVTGSKAEVEVRRILDMEEWMQDRLSDVLASGLTALGAGRNGREGTGADGRMDGGVLTECVAGGGGWFAERRERVRLEEEVARLQRVAEELTEERDQLVADLVAERRQGEEVRSELRWLRSAIGRRRRILSEANNEMDGGNAVDGGGGGVEERDDGMASKGGNCPQQKIAAE